MFNELSVQPLSGSKYDGVEKAKEFALTMGDARKKGFKRIRSHKSNSEILLSADYSLQDYLFDKTLPNEHRVNKEILFGTIVLPFIKEDDEKVVDAYIQSDFHFNNNGTKQECLGLTAALFYETLSISLNSSNHWKNNSIPITNEAEAVTITKQVNNVFSKDCFDVQAVSVFVENLGEVNLLKTGISPGDKKIHIAPHHGVDVQTAFCNRIKQNDFVVEMKSTGWGGNNFIRKIYSNGVIEITLINSLKKYALWVQTTGRNYRETEAIAQNLRERYS